MKFKKLISAALTAAVTASMFTALPASAASSFFTTNDDPTMLAELGILTDGRLDEYVTRAEFTKVAVMASSYRDYVATALKTSPYSDVPYDHWASNYIKTAVTYSLCAGYPDGTFHPDDYVSFAEAVTMLLRALGYEDSDFGSSWPYGQIGLANNLGITDGVNRSEYEAITRNDVVILLNQTLDTKMKGSSAKLLDDFDITTTDDVILLATSNEDPAVNSDKINTSAGTYKIKDTFDKSLAGRRGNIAVEDGDTLISFRASNQTVEEYTVTEIIGGDLILDGSIVDIDSSTTVYYKSNTYTYSSIISTAKEGDTFKIFRNSIGEIEYCLLIRTTASSSIITNSLEEYTIDSIVGSNIFVISDGVKSQLDLSDSTKAFNETTETTFGSLKSILSKNDTIYVKYDASGEIDYVWYKGASATSVATIGLEEYFIYSILDNGIITYKDGEFNTISVSNTTDAYVNSQSTTFSSAKSSIEMGDILYIKRDDDNSIDYIVIEEGNMEGPVVVKSTSWYKSIANFDDFTITKDGATITTSDINLYDVVYYSTDLNIAVVYSNRVTGIYESASPNMASPNTVTISGKEYTVESTEAFTALSSNGSYTYGDTITILLGKDKGIAGVVSPDDVSGSVTGYIVETGKKEFTDANTDDTYSSYYITVVSADGTENEFTMTSNCATYLNSVVTVTIDDGSTKLKVHSSASLYGEVDYSSRTIGSKSVASDVKILDISSTSSEDASLYTTVLLKRLDGVTLKDGNVMYYDTNSKGEVDEIILKNVTNDMYDFGIVTKSKSSGDSISSTVDIGGSTYTIGYNYSRGDAFRCTVQNGSVSNVSLIQLYNNRVTALTDTTATISGDKYTLSDKVVCYTVSLDGTYTLSNLNTLKNNTSDYSSIYAYYDKAYTSGGRIRILVANEKS